MSKAQCEARIIKHPHTQKPSRLSKSSRDNFSTTEHPGEALEEGGIQSLAWCLGAGSD